MLDVHDTLVLAPDVYLDGRTVVDPIRSLRVPLNESAALVLETSAGALADGIDAIARRYGLPLERARDDVLAFALTLNRAQLANIVPRRPMLSRAGSWLLLSLRLLPAGAHSGVLTRRVALRTGSRRSAVHGVVRALLPIAVVLCVVTSLVMLCAATVTGAIASGPALATGVGLALGLVSHEVGHVATLGVRPAALVIRPGRVTILHTPVPDGRRALVAVAGPLAAAAVGLTLLAVAAVAGSSVVALAGVPLVGHAVGLTVLASDGRHACAT